MPAPQVRTPAKRAADREAVARLYLKGATQASIAATIGIDQATVSRDLAALQADWQTRAAATMDAAKAAELAKVDALERTYWGAWDSPPEPPAEGLGGETLPRRIREADPRYLTGVQWCVEQRCKLFGLYPQTPTTSVTLLQPPIREVIVTLKHDEPVEDRE